MAAPLPRDPKGLFMGSHVVHGFFKGLEAPHQGSSRAGGKHLVRTSCAILRTSRSQLDHHGGITSYNQELSMDIHSKYPNWSTYWWSCLIAEPSLGIINSALTNQQRCRSHWAHILGTSNFELCFCNLAGAGFGTAPRKDTQRYPEEVWGNGEEVSLLKAPSRKAGMCIYV